MEKPTTNYEVQEKVVEILWQFAHDQSTQAHNCRAASGPLEGTTASLPAVDKALGGIMGAFGYGVEHLD